MTDQTDNSHVCPDLRAIYSRVEEKSASYDQYNFSRRHNDFLKAFFDLCQEYDSLDDFYRICIAVPLEMTGLTCSLYLYNEKTEQLQLLCNSTQGVLEKPEPAPAEIHLQDTAYESGRSYIVPIYNRSIFHASTDGTPAETWLTLGCKNQESQVFGMFEMENLAALSESDKFFFQKYCNRIGYTLHNRLILLQNISHLKFINNLVMDIEHNIIVPNMYFKYIFNQLKKKIDELKEVKGELRHMLEDDSKNDLEIDRNLLQFDDIYCQLKNYHSHLVKHHANISLFLESLFRREHFRKGHLVLRTKRCFVEKEVILPQLEHYESRLRAANISIDRPRNMLEEEFQILVDVGLLSQVYANLFSNAAKYAEEVVDHNGQLRKAVSYGRELVHNYPETGKQSVKFNVFTTGSHLGENLAEKIFEEGVRGSGTDKIPGTGHGLAFIKHVIELHGGRVGYEPTNQGNNFYFILPIPPIAIPNGD